MVEALLIASALLYVAMCAAFARSSQARFAHPATLYLTFHGLVFVVRPLIAYGLEFDFIYRLYAFQPSRADTITVILGANLAMLVFVGAACWLCRGHSAEGRPDGLEDLRARLVAPVLLACVLIGPFAVWSQLANWEQRAGRFDSMVRDAATGTLINTTQFGWFTDLGLMLAPLAVLLVWTARYRWWSWPAFLLFAVLQAGTGTRGPLVYAVLALAIAVLLERGRKWPDWRALLIFTGVTVVFSQILIDRGESVRQRFAGGAAQVQSAPTPHKPLEHMDFASFEYFEFVVYAVPQRTGTYDYFASNLQLLTEPIPRALWRDKPVGSPVQFFSLWDYGRPVGMTLSVPGAGWMALGWIGIIVQAAIWAAIYAGFYRRLVQRTGSGVGVLAYALLAATSVVALRDGVFISLVRVLPFYLGPLILALLLMRWMDRPALREPARPAGNEPAHRSPAERRRSLAGRLDPYNPSGTRWHQHGSSVR